MSGVDRESVPKVGDTVTLNDTGLEVCFGTSFGLARMKSLRMKVIRVDGENLTTDKPSYLVEVDHPEIGELLTPHWCFDICTP